MRQSEKQDKGLFSAVDRFSVKFVFFNPIIQKKQ